MNTRSQRTQCPLCEAKNFSLKFEMERGGQAFKIVSCRGCRFVFVADPEADTANHIDINKIDWAFRPRHFQIRRLLLAHLSAGQQVLEKDAAEAKSDICYGPIQSNTLPMSQRADFPTSASGPEFASFRTRSRVSRRRTP